MLTFCPRIYPIPRPIPKPIMKIKSMAKRRLVGWNSLETTKRNYKCDISLGSLNLNLFLCILPETTKRNYKF